MVGSSNLVPFTFASPGTTRNATLFRPPRSPPSTASSPAVATTTDYFSAGSRKRPRSDSSQASPAHTPRTTRPTSAQYPMTPEESIAAISQQDYPWVNEHYDLAGGFDTPSLQATAAIVRSEDAAHDRILNRAARDIWIGEPKNDNHISLSGPLARERNGKARLSATVYPGQSNTGWALFAIGLVGKMFNFGSSVFRGFYSGGGQGYDLRQDSLPDPEPNYHLPACSTPLPGAWAEAESVFDLDARHESDSPDRTTTRPPNKRRQTDKEAWVYVSKVQESPKRNELVTITSRNGHTTRPTASRASSRRSLVSTPGRRHSHVSHPLPSPTHHITDRHASLAPMRSPNSKTDHTRQTYFSPDAERYVRRQAKQDRAADKAIHNMSRQLADLIRQGQEALGTKFSVDTDIDEGFMDEI